METNEGFATAASKDSTKEPQRPLTPPTGPAAATATLSAVDRPLLADERSVLPRISRDERSGTAWQLKACFPSCRGGATEDFVAACDRNVSAHYMQPISGLRF